MHPDPEASGTRARLFCVILYIELVLGEERRAPVCVYVCVCVCVCVCVRVCVCVCVCMLDAAEVRVDILRGRVGCEWYFQQLGGLGYDLCVTKRQRGLHFPSRKRVYCVQPSREAVLNTAMRDEGMG